MIKPWTTKFPAILSPTFLSIAFLGSFQLFTEAWAIENCNKVCKSGHTKCQLYCDSHNNSGTKWTKCLAQWDKYWYSGKNPQSIGRPNPPNPPPRKVNPGKLKHRRQRSRTRTPPRSHPGKFGQDRKNNAEDWERRQ